MVKAVQEVKQIPGLESRDVRFRAFFALALKYVLLLTVRRIAL